MSSVEAFKPTILRAVSLEPQARGVMAKKWYVVQAYSGFENKVKLALEDRFRQSGLEDSFGEVLIPKENVQELRGDKKRNITRNFYPGYVFVQMELTEETWYLVKDTPKVNGFIGGRHPAPVPESEIQAIAGAKPKPKVVFDNGDHVRVVEGAFMNYTGVVQEVNTAKQKLKVLVSIFGRATPVELDYIQVEKTA